MLNLLSESRRPQILTSVIPPKKGYTFQGNCAYPGDYLLDVLKHNCLLKWRYENNI